MSTTPPAMGERVPGAMDPPLPAIAAGRMWKDRYVERMATYAIHAAHELGVLDALAHGPLGAAELARQLQAHPDSMYRLLRALTSLDVLSRQGRIFSPGPLAAYAGGGSIGDPDPDNPLERAWAALAASVRFGRPAIEISEAKPLFEYLDGDPRLAEWFHDRMRERGGERDEIVPRAVDFGRFGSIVDIGGGTGGFLTRVLKQHPTMRGVLLETRSAIDRAAQCMDPEVRERLSLVVGDMFDRFPPGHDAYVLSSILHDWDDGAAVRLLSTARSAMDCGALLLIIEMVLDEDSRNTRLNLLDLDMLVLTGGRERTVGEYAALLAAAELEIDAHISTGCEFAVIAARRIP